MGYVTLTVHDCPEEQVHEVIAIVDNFRTEHEHRWSGGPMAAHELRLHHAYSNEGDAETLHQALTEQAPGASWIIRLAGSDEYAAEWFMHTSELGEFREDGDDDEPRFTGSQVVDWIKTWEKDDQPRDIADLYMIVRAATGQLHREAMPPAPAKVVRALAGCATCDEDRKVRQVEGTNAWVHVDSGREWCDDAVTLVLDEGDPLNRMPCTYEGGHFNGDPELYAIRLPNARIVGYKADQFCRTNIAEPV